MKKTIALLFAAVALAGCNKENSTDTTSTMPATNSTASRSVNEPAGAATNTPASQPPSTAPNTTSQQQ